MTAHIFNANLDPDYPAPLSQRILGSVLRERFGWDGVVVTDDLDMKAISANYGFDEAIALAINAGNDILLYSNFNGD